ncbi:hypothetical protein [Mycobacteroides abscessus]|uniref:hypothetical protein n=1 Tax=Mycobacteroides abscessus TaxID=36809 RepID=UPI001877C26A|nr:hypothetical protein [Mycobacteroides abscessus]
MRKASKTQLPQFFQPITMHCPGCHHPVADHTGEGCQGDNCGTHICLRTDASFDRFGLPAERHPMSDDYHRLLDRLYDQLDRAGTQYAAHVLSSKVTGRRPSRRPTLDKDLAAKHWAEWSRRITDLELSERVFEHGYHNNPDGRRSVFDLTSEEATAHFMQLVESGQLDETKGGVWRVC